MTVWFHPQARAGLQVSVALTSGSSIIGNVLDGIFEKWAHIWLVRLILRLIRMGKTQRPGRPMCRSPYSGLSWILMN